MPPILIAAEVLDAVLAAAAASPEAEVCGLLFGTAARIDGMLATANVAADTARTFEIDPEALFHALRAARAGGPALVGHYHSHPGGSAAPSPRDRAAAEPGRLWLIVGNGAARLWLAAAGGFRERALVPA